MTKVICTRKPAVIIRLTCTNLHKDKESKYNKQHLHCHCHIMGMQTCSIKSWQTINSLIKANRIWFFFLPNHPLLI